jgi:parallel beta-helix repeat protein
MRKRQFILYVTIVFAVLLAQGQAQASQSLTIITVTNTNDAGVGSLRQAILDANTSPDETLIAFNIPGEGVRTIETLSPLPTITAPAIIDGLTQSGASCEHWPPTLRIELNGGQAGHKTDGLEISAGNSLVRGLVINRFDGNGIVLNSNPGNVLECNFIGTDATGTVALGNDGTGVLIKNSTSNRVGGATPETRNLISANHTDGLAIVGYLASHNTVAGNFIGTDVTGAAALGNRQLGVYIREAPANMIGGLESGARNIISGNSWDGIHIHPFSAQGNTVAGNYIGTDLTGIEPLGNGGTGIVISQASNNTIGGTTVAARNVVSSNGRDGVYLFESHNNTVAGNYIGVNTLGTGNLGNQWSGVSLYMASYNIIGGATLEAQNVIAGNQDYGIYIYGTRSIGNSYADNILGTDVTGAVLLSNGIGDIELERVGPRDLGQMLDLGSAPPVF